MKTSQCLGQLDVASGTIIQGHHIELGDLKLKVFTAMGAQDELEVAATVAVGDEATRPKNPPTLVDWCPLKTGRRC